MTLRLFLPLAALLLSASAAPGRSPLERAVLDEINFARGNPQAYAERLRTYRTYFQGRVVYYPGNPTGLKTSEGVAAVAYARVRTVTEFYRKDRLLSAEIEALDRDLACPDALASFAAAAPMDDFDAFFALA